ncbi:MAG: hypothetical protein ACI8XX_001839 [Polaribacter sp.]|jgi:hypothetical protein
MPLLLAPPALNRYALANNASVAHSYSHSILVAMNYTDLQNRLLRLALLSFFHGTQTLSHYREDRQYRSFIRR